ncbi:MAG: glycosyltransferase [Acidobacteriota bacterium]
MLELTVVIPVYNERVTILEILKRVEAVDIDKEILIVDDCSTDGTREILRAHVEGRPGVRVLYQECNQGKGSALARGFKEARGDMVIVQDADLEYDPADYPSLLAPIRAGEADVVYGSRFTGSPRRVLYFWHSVGNRLLTLFSNMMTNLNLTDMETCYKVFRREIIQAIPLRSRRFGFEPEITAKLAKMKVRIYEVPISYHGRSYDEGKKITWKDGLSALWHIFRFSAFGFASADPAYKSLEAMSAARRFNKWMYDRIRRFVGRRVLEVGSGRGNLTRFFLKQDRIIASDVDPEHLGILRRQFSALPNCGIMELDLAKFDAATLRDEQLDTIVCLNVLEHVEDDRTALRGIHEALVPGGRMILLVPCYPFLFSSLDSSIGHYRRYRWKDLKAQIEHAGFRVIHHEAFNAVGILGWFINGKMLRRKSVPPLQVRLYDRLVFLFKIERMLHLPFGLSCIAVGEKPVA